MSKATATIESFLTAKTLKLDKTKVSIIARKKDSKDKSETAERYFAKNSKIVSPLNELIESFKNRVASDAKTAYAHFISKDDLLDILANQNEMDVMPDNTLLPAVNAMKTKLQKQFSEEVSDVDFLTWFKIALLGHYNRTKAESDLAMDKMSVKAKAIFTGNEKAEFLKVFAEKNKTLYAAKAKGATA